MGDGHPVAFKVLLSLIPLLSDPREERPVGKLTAMPDERPSVSQSSFPTHRDQALRRLGPHQSVSEAAQAEGLELATKARESRWC